MLRYRHKKTRDPARLSCTLLPRNRSTPDLASIGIIPRNRSAQVGETISWVIATVVIIVILIIFIYISVLMSKVKVIEVLNLKSDLGKESELLSQKTSFAHQLADDKNKEMIDNLLKENEK